MKSIKVLLVAIYIELTGFIISYMYDTNSGEAVFICGFVVALIGAIIGLTGCFISVNKEEKKTKD